MFVDIYMMLGSDCIGVMLKFLIEEGNFLLWPLMDLKAHLFFLHSMGKKEQKNLDPSRLAYEIAYHISLKYEATL